MRRNVEFIGFSIKGIRYILEKIEFPEAKKGPYILAEIIDVMIRANPGASNDFIQMFLANTLELEVEDFRYEKAA